jgi:N-methylhydantoinase A
LVAYVTRDRLPPLRFRDAPPRPGSERRAYFGPEQGTWSTPIIGRGDLDRSPRDGPFVVEEYDATVVVPPNCAAWLDELGNIRIEVRWT